MSSDSNPVIGELKWKAVEVSSGAVLGQGRVKVRLGDVQIREFRTEEGLRQRKVVSLDSEFALELPHFVRAHVPTGFGLVASRRDIPTFCWEWFQIDAPNHAFKIQETGELEFFTRQQAEVFELTRVEFIRDISIRLWKRDGAGPASPPDWRVNILASSLIVWPSLLDGIVKAN